MLWKFVCRCWCENLFVNAEYVCVDWLKEFGIGSDRFWFRLVQILFLLIFKSWSCEVVFGFQENEVFLGL